MPYKKHPFRSQTKTMERFLLAGGQLVPWKVFQPYKSKDPRI